MKINLNKPLSIICLIFLAFCIIFSSCKDGNIILIEEPGDYENPDAGKGGGTTPPAQPQDISFSHNSGLYASGFSLTLTAQEGRTIYYTEDGSEPVPGKAGTKTYSAPISIINRTLPVQPNVLATITNTEQMYIRPDDPRGHSPGIYQPEDNVVPKATVIRAIAVDGSGKRSDVITKTYFVGTNAQLFGNQNVRVISLVSDPAGLVSEETGIMVRGGPGIRYWDDWRGETYNFMKRGEAWERVASFELFEGSTLRTLQLATNAGIRVRGGYSRDHGQKSFNVYFRSPSDLVRINAPTGSGNTFDGINNLKNFVLIPGANKANGTPVDTVKSFMLRTGGNDRENTKFLDVFIHDLLSDRNFTTQAAVPVILYLNGEYWGPTNMQERYSDNFLEYKYGVDRDNVITIDNGQLDDGNPGELSLYENAIDDMINTGNYQQFCSKFDIDNFIDYWAAQVYIYNEDWPQNNYIVWRTRNPEPGNPYGDTKWRYSLHDSEFSLGIYSGGSTTGQNGFGNAFHKIINGEYSGHRHNRLFVKLLENEDFCKKFADVMLELYNVDFHPDKVEERWNYYNNLYRPLIAPDSNNDIPGFRSRWLGWSNYDYHARIAKDYLKSNIRNQIPGYLQSYLKVPAGALKNITLSTTLSGTSITINNFTPNIIGSWTGLFNTQGGVTITASPAPSGYEFDGWIVNGNPVDQPRETTMTITSDSAITAKYKPQGITVVDPQSISITGKPPTVNVGSTFNLTANFTPSNTTYKTLTWTSSRPNIVEVDSTGRVTVKGGGTAAITATSTVNSSIKGTIDITATALFMAEPHPEGIKLIIDTSLLPNWYRTNTNDERGDPEWKSVQFRLSGWGNGARVQLGSYNWATDPRFTGGKAELIYPFTVLGKTYSLDIGINIGTGTDQIHSITETAGGGAGELSRTGSLLYNNKTIYMNADLNLVSSPKIERGGWRIVFREGTGWDDSKEWYQIDNWNYSNALGTANNFNFSITINDLLSLAQEDIKFSWINTLVGKNVFVLLYYDISYDGFSFDTQELSTTFRFPSETFALPNETLVSTHNRYTSNPHNNFTSASDYEIVNLPNDGRTNVMKVSYPDDWATVIYNLGYSSGQKISIDLNVDVRRAGDSGNVHWQINNNIPVGDQDSYPTVVYQWIGNEWITISVTDVVITLARNDSDSAALYLTNHQNAGINSIFYFDNFSITVTPLP